ncbi:MAG: NAD(P)H-dependent dehydrogenase/reductase [Denitrovibrio sp.]|nr:MAG: NAD(P)H-dependent dehydrogenase/reductase [Denitrovibrio sp.]
MIEILRNRRSTRKFTSEKISDEQLNVLKEALLLAPTSRNFEPCEFIIVRDKEMLKKLSVLKPHGATFLAECDTAFVICGDTDKSDVCVEDTSIASIILQLTAESLGLGSCWAQVRMRNHNEEMQSDEYIKQTLNLPANLMVTSVIGIGYAETKLSPKDFDSLKHEKIHIERY